MKDNMTNSGSSTPPSHIKLLSKYDPYKITDKFDENSGNKKHGIDQKTQDTIKIEPFKSSWTKVSASGIHFEENWPTVERIVRSLIKNSRPFDDERRKDIYQMLAPIYRDLLEVLPTQPAMGRSGTTTDYSSRDEQSSERSASPSFDDGLGSYQSPSEVSANLIAVLNEAKANDAEKLRIFIEVCAPPLRRLERRTDLTGEQLTDVMVLLLRELNFSDRRTAIGVCTLVPFIWTILNKDLDSGEVTSGWLKSLASLATLLTQAGKASKQPRARIISGIYYHDILSLAANSFNIGNLDDVVEQAANNLSAIIADRLQNRNQSISEAERAPIRQIISDLRDIAIGVGSQIKHPVDIEHGSKVLGILGVDVSESEVSAFASYLDRQKMVSSGEPDGIGSVIGHAVTGLCRALLKMSDRTAAAFFNAGVTLHRFLKDNADQDYRKPLIQHAEILLNSLGLAWALRLNDKHESALGDGDGFDCAINLVGTAMNFDQDRKLQELIGNLVLMLTTLPANLEGITGDDMGRMKLAATRLKLDASSVRSGDASLANLTANADEVIRHILTALSTLYTSAASGGQARRDGKGDGAGNAMEGAKALNVPEWREGNGEETANVLHFMFECLDQSGSDRKSKISEYLSAFRKVESGLSTEVRLRSIYDADYMNKKIFYSLLNSGLIEEGELRDCFDGAYKKDGPIDEAIKTAFS